MNKVMLFGNLGADPELRQTTGGQPVLNMRLATTDSFVDKNGQRQERTEWHRVTVWGKRADALARILKKGEKILVEGRLSTTTYEKDGQKHYSTEVVAYEVELVGKSGGPEESPF